MEKIARFEKKWLLFVKEYVKIEIILDIFVMYSKKIP